MKKILCNVELDGTYIEATSERVQSYGVIARNARKFNRYFVSDEKTIKQH